MSLSSGIGKAVSGRFGGSVMQHAFSVGGMINVGFAVMDVRRSMKDNPMMPTGEAIGRVAANYAAMELIPGYIGAQITYDIAKTAGEMAYQGYHQAPFVGLQKAGHFEGVRAMDNANMATMRQRSLSLLNESRMNARSTLGSEARMLHRNQVAY